MSRARDTTAGTAYERSGSSSQPVLLIHAGIADRRMWDPQWAGLTSEHDCLRLDLRGFGESTAAPVGNLSPVDDVLAVLDNEHVERAHVVGASLGAGVAVEIALTRPSLVESLLICPPGGSLLAERTPDLEAFLIAERSALAENDLEAAVAANIDHWVVGPTRPAQAVDPAVMTAVRSMQRSAFEIQLGWDPEPDANELDPPALDRLGEVRSRTLILVGAHDLSTTHDAARRLAEGVPGARTVTWPTVAHLPSMERPVEFLRLLLDWLG